MAEGPGGLPVRMVDGTDESGVPIRVASGPVTLGGGNTATPNISPIAELGILNHAGPPVAADGTFAVNDTVYDSTWQKWGCSVAGSPGTWLALGSGKVLGSATLATTFTMTTAATVEDVPGMSVTFTYDGRPVRFVLTPVLTAQDQAAIRLITVTIVRASDNAIQQTVVRTTTASTTETQPLSMDTGPLTAWPSDAVAFVVGTSYTIKLRLLSGASSKAQLVASAAEPYKLYVITA